MDFQKVIQAINNKEYSPVYVLHGSEYFLKQQFYQCLLGKNNSEETDIMTIDLKDNEFGFVLDEANAFSFFSDRRIVIVENSTFIQAQSKLKLDKNDEASLISYLEEPNPSTILIFETGINQMDKRKKTTKALLKNACFVDISPLDDKEVERYIKQYLMNSSLKISNEAVNELLNRVNYQLTLAMSEITKIETFALSNETISVDTVRKLVPRTLESDVFELTNVVMNRQINQAIQIYEDLLLMKNEPIALHALLVSQFRIMLQVKILSQKGYLEGQIAEQLNVHPYRVKKALQSSKMMNLTELQKFYLDLSNVDYQMKTGIGIKETYFYLLLTKLIAKK